MEFVIESSKERLDKFLAKNLKEFSRNKIQQIIKNNAVKVNGLFITKPSFRLRPKDKVAVLENQVLSYRKVPEIKPEPNILLDIVYEDKDMAVINKPAGLLTHPPASQTKHTLVKALLAKYPEIANVGENPLRPGIVHRLDKGTSGLIMVAKNQKAFLFIKEQFLNREISKKYLALVEGVPKEKEGVIDFPIRPSKKMRLKKVAVQRAEPARKSTRVAKTEYKIKKVIGNNALLEVSPLTGRTHQIRVHLSAIGHPVVGDKLYGSKIPAKRQFLHAYFLKFVAPNGAPVTLEIELPEDLKKMLY